MKTQKLKAVNMHNYEMMQRRKPRDTINTPLRLRLILVVLFLFFVIFDVGVIYLTTNNQSIVDLNSKADASVVNGILTGFAIIFGFTSVELREMKAPLLDKLFLNMPLLCFFLIGVVRYPAEVLSKGYPTYWSMLTLLAGIIFNVLYAILIPYAKGYYEEFLESGKI